MSGANVPVKRKEGRSTLVRPRFGPGMLLHHEDMEQLSSYTRELSRLMFRSLFGCGVVCGLVVKVATRCDKVYVTVGAGLALDCCGDPVHVPTEQSIAIDEDDPNLTSPLWVVLCGTTKCCAPRPSMCAADEDEAPTVCTRERDYFEIRVLSKRPECICGCPEPREHEESRCRSECKCVDPSLPCYADHYCGECSCHCDDCSDCGCECVLLARLVKTGDKERPWTADHRVRRFVRPVLMCDPQVEAESTPYYVEDVALKDVPAPTQPPSGATKPSRASKSRRT